MIQKIWGEKIQSSTESSRSQFQHSPKKGKTLCALPPPQACMLKNLSFSVSENELGHVFCLRNANNFHFQVEKRKYTQANMPSRMWLSSVPGSKGTPRATYKEANPGSVWVPNLGKEN